MNRIYILAATILILTTTACNNKKNQENDPPDNSSCIISPELKKTLLFDKVTSSMVNSELELTASVDYDQNNLYKYQSLASGVVQKVYFNLGDFVQQGQVLAEIRTTALSDQTSDLRRAEAELKLADRNLKSTQRLYDDGLASDKDLMEAKNEVSSRQLEINRIQESLSIQGGNMDKKVLIVRAPMSGYIVDKKIMNGYQVQEGEDNLFTLSNLKKVWVMANVHAAQLGKVKVGEDVEIKATAYPDKIFTGRISRLSNVFDPEEKVMKAIIEINNSSLELKPDMMVSVIVHEDTKERALAVPERAVIFDDDAYQVVLYKSDCDVRNVPVQLVSHHKDVYYITSNDLSEGDSIISRNQLLIYNKLKGR